MPGFSVNRIDHVAQNPFADAWRREEAAAPPPLRARALVVLPFADFRDMIFAGDPKDVQWLTSSLYAGDAFILKGAFTCDFMSDLIGRCHALGAARPSSFHKMLEGCPDFNRIIDHEITKNYSITAIKHSYYFFPWNDDPLDVLPPVNAVWRVFKHLGGYDMTAYERNTPKDGVVDRLQIVRYPAGGGGLKRHRDPTKNQRVIIGAMMSTRGRDYESGGFYVIDRHDRELDLEPLLETGDMVCGYPTVHHGVADVDVGKPLDWTSPEGRWFLGLYSNDSDEVRDRVTAVREENYAPPPND